MHSYFILNMNITIRTPSEIYMNEFDLNKLCDTPQIMFIGMRGTGKTTLIKHIIHHLHINKLIDSCVIISPTDRMQSQYKKCFKNIYHDYNSSILENIIREQQENPDRKIVLVLDDCIGKKGSWTSCPIFNDLFGNAKKYKITIFLSMQYPLGFTEKFRSLFDYVCLFSEDYNSNIKRLYNNYCNDMDYELFAEILRNATNNYNVLIVNNTDQNNKLTYFRANDDVSNIKFDRNNLDDISDSESDSESDSDSKNEKCIERITIVNYTSIIHNISESNLKLLECIQDKKSDNDREIIEKISRSNMIMSKMLHDEHTGNLFDDLIKGT